MFVSCPHSNVSRGDRVRVRLGMCPSPTIREGVCTGWRRVVRTWECRVNYDGMARNVHYLFHPAHVLRLSQAEQGAG